MRNVSSEEMMAISGNVRGILRPTPKRIQSTARRKKKLVEVTIFI